MLDGNAEKTHDPNGILQPQVALLLQHALEGWSGQPRVFRQLGDRAPLLLQQPPQVFFHTTSDGLILCV